MNSPRPYAITHRSCREAFPAERFPAVFGPYYSVAVRWRRAVTNAVLWCAAVALLLSLVYAPALWRWAGL